MPTRVNLKESGLRHSQRLHEKRKVEAREKADAKYRVPYGTNAKKKVLRLLTIISLRSSVRMPQHQVPPNETYLLSSDKFPHSLGSSWVAHANKLTDPTSPKFVDTDQR